MPCDLENCAHNTKPEERLPTTCQWFAAWQMVCEMRLSQQTVVTMLLRLKNSVDAMTRMMRHQERVANNLANANTVGYKKDRMFTRILNEHLDNDGAPTSDKIVSQMPDLTEGELEQTGNPLDVAIHGDGFFELSDDANDTKRYTRAGRFTLDAEGQLRTPEGYGVEGESGPIQIEKTDGNPIVIDHDGTVRLGNQQVGKIRLVSFDDPTVLKRLDDASFDAGTQEPTDVEVPDMRQGFVEGSNVNAVEEMAEMIEHFRNFETQQRSIRTTDQLLGRITRDLGRF